MNLTIVPLDLIDEPGFDVRAQIIAEDLEDLAVSISRVGVLNPLRVFDQNGRYEIEDGHRRFLAAKMIGLQEVPCYVVDSPEEKREIFKLHANLHKEDLSPLDLARTLRHLMDVYHYTRDELAHYIGRSESRVSQLLALLNYDPVVLEALQDQRISEQIARALQQIPDPEKRAYYLAYCLDGGATINTVRGWVQMERVQSVTPTLPERDLDGPPPDTSYEPMRHKCPCCIRTLDAQTFINIMVCADCHYFLGQLFKNISEDRHKEMTE